MRVQAARRRAAENPNNNIVIIGRRAELLQHADEEEYDRLRCAIVSRGGKPGRAEGGDVCGWACSEG